MTQLQADIIIVSFYKFTPLADYAARRQSLLDICIGANVSGTVLLAHEGINGTIAGCAAGIARVLDHIRTLPGCADLELKQSTASSNPFYRMKVRLKREIVTMGVSDIDPEHSTGQYVEPQDWNELISDPEVVVIDTRNAYEVNIGTFAGAVNPATGSFREFPEWLKAQPAALKKTKVAMFCTGGIRCEKATAYARKLGFEDVYHLKGGILSYLRDVPEAQSKWEGECFVFDQRVSVKHDLVPGDYGQCYACRMPLSVADQQLPSYVTGTSCLHCIDGRSEPQRQRYRERQQQIERAKARGNQHLGTGAQASRQARDK